MALGGEGGGGFLGMAHFYGLGPKLGSDQPNRPPRGDLGSGILFFATGAVQQAPPSDRFWLRLCSQGQGVGGAGPGHCVPGDHPLTRIFEHFTGRLLVITENDME